MASATIELLGGFRLTCRSKEIETPLSAQRVIALLALSGKSLRRSYIAGNLWSESSEARAGGSLRSALWRIRKIDEGLLNVGPNSISIGPDVIIDVRALEEAARSLASSTCCGREISASDLDAELLPDWHDDWVVFERERLRQLGMHALEQLAHQLSATGRHAEAIEAALAAIKCEVLRESSHRALIEIHAAEGNIVEAVRHFEMYRLLLQRELGVDASADLAGYMESLTSR